MAVTRPFRLRAAPAPPAPAAGPAFWVDASNYTGALTDTGCAELKAAGVVGVIIQAITGTNGISFTTQQLQACARNGLRVQGYVWCNHNGSAATAHARLALFDGYALEHLWVDVEEAGLTRDDVDRIFAIADAYLGRPAGLYSGKWYFDQQGWSHKTWWSSRDLWASIYDGVANVDVGFVPFHGWTQCAMKQHAGTSSIGSVHQIDLDVSRS